MIGKFKKWLRGTAAPAKASEARPRPQQATGERRNRSDRRQQYIVKIDPPVSGMPEDLGPEKNALVRKKYQREDTGTHETLTIVDDSVIETGEETGIDPYNTGNFDRSRNWDKRFRN